MEVDCRVETEEPGYCTRQRGSSELAASVKSRERRPERGGTSETGETWPQQEGCRMDQRPEQFVSMTWSETLVSRQWGQWLGAVPATVGHPES